MNEELKRLWLEIKRLWERPISYEGDICLALGPKKTYGLCGCVHFLRASYSREVLLLAYTQLQNFSKGLTKPYSRKDELGLLYFWPVTLEGAKDRVKACEVFSKGAYLE